MRSIVLIGFMGAGKSAVGRELAQRLRLPRRDTDEMIRQRFGKTILDVFASEGEGGFRAAETEALRDVRSLAPIVLVTGGGVVVREENLILLKAIGYRVWLDGEEEALWQRARRRNDRPLLRSEDPRRRFGDLYRERAAIYQKVADARVDTTGKSIAEVTTEIMALYEHA